MRVDGVHRYSRLPSISIDSRRGEGSEIVTWITIETLLTWVYLVPDRKPWVCLPISFPFEARRVYRRKKNREWNAARKEWKLNGEVDTRGSSSLFLHFVENRSDICHRRITAALLDEFQGRRKTAAIAPWKKMIHPGKIQACTFSSAWPGQRLMRPRPPRWIAPPRVIDGQLGRAGRKARFDKERHFYLPIQRYAISRANALLSSRSG